MQSNQSSVFTLLVDNEFGVLTRITALIRRAGWNIRSLAVAETAKPEVSRLTICLECRNNTLEFVLDRLGRLDCVRSIVPFAEENQVARELALVRLHSSNAPAVLTLCEDYGATVLEQRGDDYMLSLTCQPDVLDVLLPVLRKAGMTDLARTGAISLKRDGEEEQA